MTTVRQQILDSFRDKEYRRAFARQHLMRNTALQIREMRKRRNLTQAQLGELAGMGQSSISELEAPGVRNPNVDTLQSLAEALDVVLFVRYGTFSELADYVAGLTSTDLAVPDFDSDPRLEEGSDSTRPSLLHHDATIPDYQSNFLDDRSGKIVYIDGLQGTAKGEAKVHAK